MSPARRGRTRLAGRDSKLNHMTHPASSPINRLVDLARRLDREADCELQHGHIGRAEHLAHLAAELRGVSA